MNDLKDNLSVSQQLWIHLTRTSTIASNRRPIASGIVLTRINNFSKYRELGTGASMALVWNSDDEFREQSGGVELWTDNVVHPATRSIEVFEAQQRLDVFIKRTLSSFRNTIEIN